jgi:Leucine-rich repeat (LRR) protein
LSQELQEISVSDNPRLQSPPPSVASKGTSAILAFLQLFLDAESSNQLWLGRLELTIIPPDISQLSKVSLFDATCNNIKALPFDIGTWASLQSLQELRLSHNPISSLPVSISKLAQLRVMLLDHCDLRDVPAEYYVLSQLNVLNLDSNPKLSQPPTEILTQGLDTVRRLWNDLLQVPRLFLECIFLKHVLIVFPVSGRWICLVFAGNEAEENQRREAVDEMWLCCSARFLQ